LETTSGLGGQRVPVESSADAPTELQRRLIVKGLERARRDLGRLRRRPRELLEGVDTRRPQAADLLAPDPGHQAQVVFPRPLLVAYLSELAQRAVLHRIGLGPRGRAELGEEAGADAAVVGGAVGGGQGATLADAEEDVHLF